MNSKVTRFTAFYAVLLCTWPTHAFEVQRNLDGASFHWTKTTVAFYVDTGGVEGVAFERIEQAVLQAFGVWNDVCCSRFRFEYLGAKKNALADFDTQLLSANINTISWTSTPKSYLEMLPGITNVHVNTDGSIIDVDIQLNARDFRWTSSAPTATTVHLTNALVYYLGLAFGLTNSSIPASIMNERPVPGDTSKLHLDNDDVAAICRLYPSTPRPDCVIDLDFSKPQPTADVVVDRQPTNDVLAGGGHCQSSRGPHTSTCLVLLFCVVVPLRLGRCRNRHRLI